MSDREKKLASINWRHLALEYAALCWPDIAKHSALKGKASREAQTLVSGHPDAITAHSHESK